MDHEDNKAFPDTIPDDFNPTPVEILVADQKRAKNEALTLPGGSHERRRLDEVPDDLLIEKRLEHGGWCTTLRLLRKNLRSVYDFVYGAGKGGLPCLDGSPDDEVELIGYWD